MPVLSGLGRRRRPTEQAAFRPFSHAQGGGRQGPRVRRGAQRQAAALRQVEGRSENKVKILTLSARACIDARASGV